MWGVGEERYAAASWRSVGIASHERFGRHVAPQGRSELEGGEGEAAAEQGDMEFCDAHAVLAFCGVDGDRNINMEWLTGHRGRDAAVSVPRLHMIWRVFEGSGWTVLMRLGVGQVLLLRSGQSTNADDPE